MGYSLPDRVLGNTYDFIGKTGGKGLMGIWNPQQFEVEELVERIYQSAK